MKFVMNHRNFLKLMGFVCLGVLFSFFINPKKAGAKKTKPINLLDEKDTLAQAMKYHHDAGKAAIRTDKKAFCHNCSKYNVCMEGDKSCKPLTAKALSQAKAAPCQIFKAKFVAMKGWCLSWEAKS